MIVGAGARVFPVVTVAADRRSPVALAALQKLAHADEAFGEPNLLEWLPRDVSHDLGAPGVVAAHQHVSSRGHDEPVGGGIAREREGLPLLEEEPAAVREHEVIRILHGLVLSLRDTAAAVAG